MQKAKWEKAKKNYEKALAVHGENATAWANLGLCDDQLGDQAKALECYDKTLEYNPWHKHALVNKGFMLAKKKRFKEALKCFEEAIQADPDFQVASDNRQRVLQEMKQEGGDVMIQLKDLKLINNSGKYCLKAGKDLVKSRPALMPKPVPIS